MENFYENIEDYLSGDLSEADKDTFEKTLKEQPDLQKEVIAYQEIKDSLAADFVNKKDNLAVKQTLESMSGAYFSKETPTTKIIPLGRKKWLKPLISAAAVALVLVLAWPYITTKAPLQYADVAHHTPVSFTEMGTSENDLAEAEKAFNAGNYSAAIPFLQNYLMAHDGNTEAWFYMGICKLETGQEDSAAMLFQQVSSVDSPYQIEAIWYLGLTHFKNKDFKKATTALAKIPKSSEHFELAQELMVTMSE